jgi:hypothetical protein
MWSRIDVHASRPSRAANAFRQIRARYRYQPAARVPGTCKSTPRAASMLTFTVLSIALIDLQRWEPIANAFDLPTSEYSTKILPGRSSDNTAALVSQNRIRLVTARPCPSTKGKDHNQQPTIFPVMVEPGVKFPPSKRTRAAKGCDQKKLANTTREIAAMRCSTALLDEKNTFPILSPALSRTP